MNLIKRAWLSITRKKGKSALLFIILLVVATLALSGISIKNASGEAAEKLSEALGGRFIMMQDTSNSSKQVQKNIGNGITATQYQGEALSKELAEKVASVTGVTGYNAENIGPAEIRTTTGENLTLKSIEGSFFSNIEGMNNQITVYGYTNVETSTLFRGGTLKLVEGRQITSADHNALMIHKELAEKNGLKLGDSLVISMNKFITGGDEEAASLKQECKIVGIFDSTVETPVTAYSTQGDLLENNVLMDVETSLKLYPWASEGYYRIYFDVNNPAQLESIVAQVKKLDSIDWSAFRISLDDTEYEAAAKPLKNLDKLITTLLIVIILVCTTVLCLLLTMWTKGRVREAGILLSMGIGKYKILFQHITEVAMIAVLAFGISYFSSAAIAQKIGDAMLGSPTSGAVQQTESSQPDDGTFTFNREDAPVNTADLTKLNVTVEPGTFWWVFVIGGIVIIVSVLISSVQILRVKPKELLTKMS